MEMNIMKEDIIKEEKVWTIRCYVKIRLTDNEFDRFNRMIKSSGKSKEDFISELVSDKLKEEDN